LVCRKYRGKIFPRSVRVPNRNASPLGSQATTEASFRSISTACEERSAPELPGDEVAERAQATASNSGVLLQDDVRVIRRISAAGYLGKSLYGTSRDDPNVEMDDA
jgi:hypothetical protein